jgi:hypothetical protein
MSGAKAGPGLLDAEALDDSRIGPEKQLSCEPPLNPWCLSCIPASVATFPRLIR